MALTPHPAKPGGRWFAAVTAVQPLNGQSTMCHFNLMTGETRAEGEAGEAGAPALVGELALAGA